MNICMMSMMMRGKFTPAEIVKTTLDCRMSAIDWITTHDTPAGKLKKLCADARLPIAAHTMLPYGFMQGKDGMEEFKRSLDDAVVMGAPIMMIPPFATQGAKSMSEDRKKWIEYFSKAAPLAVKAGVIPTLESTALEGSPIITTEEVLEVMNAVPEMRLTFDNGNVATAENDAESYRRLKKYVVHIHLKDWSISDTPKEGYVLKRDGRYYAPALIGKGNVDMRAFWEAVKESGYTGYANLETEDRQLPIQEALKLVSDQLRAW